MGFITLRLALVASLVALARCSESHSTFEWSNDHHVEFPKIHSAVDYKLGFLKKLKEKKLALVHWGKPAVVDAHVPTKETIHYPVWKVHKYKGIEIRPVQVIEDHYNIPSQVEHHISHYDAPEHHHITSSGDYSHYQESDHHYSPIPVDQSSHYVEPVHHHIPTSVGYGSQFVVPKTSDYAYEPAKRHGPPEISEPAKRYGPPEISEPTKIHEVSVPAVQGLRAFPSELTPHTAMLHAVAQLPEVAEIKVPGIPVLPEVPSLHLSTALFTQVPYQSAQLPFAYPYQHAGLLNSYGQPISGAFVSSQLPEQTYSNKFRQRDLTSAALPEQAPSATELQPTAEAKESQQATTVQE